MYRKTLKYTAVLLLACMLMLVSVSAAFAEGGTGPESALAPDGTWGVLESGEQVWYAFDYDGGEDKLGAWLKLLPTDGANFSVLTPEQMKLWQNTGKIEAIGMGTANEDIDADLSWCGCFTGAGRYYILLEDSAARDGVTYYSLQLVEDGVPLKAAPTAAAEVAAVSAVAAAPFEEEVAIAGTGVDDAMPLKGEWKELPQGKSHWYSFRYDGNEGQIKINLDADSTKDIRFSVRTPENVGHWQKTGELVACGCGSKNDAESGDLFWTGNFNSPGTYYVVVEETGNADGATNYALEISGKGVS